MIGELLLSSDKKSIASPRSAYQPSASIRDLTSIVKMAYQDGEALLETPFQEFNNVSLIERMNQDQRAWLSWTPEPFQGEDDWRWNGIRPITRNKVISTAAHLTAQLLIPNVFAQNEFDEEDRGAAYVMKDLIEYNIRRSNYETAFLFGVISGLVNPISYFKVEYCQGMQEMWVNGKKEQVIDDIFSGFQHSLIAPDDILFENMYCYEWQKQDWIIEKKGHLSMGAAEAKYGTHPNFRYVRPGIRVILHDDGMFYDVEDVNGNLVEEITYKNRRKDLEVCFLGGIYMGTENPEYNPFIHRTNKNKPKYDTAKFGYEPIDAMRFTAYKSLVAKMANDQEAADREWQLYFDASFLGTFPPTVTFGAGKLDRSVIAPATVTNVSDKDAKITPINIANPSVALAALREAERSLIESSQDPQGAGIKEGPEKTARESILLQRNQETNLGLAAKMIGVMVKDVGNLMVDDIIRHETAGRVDELTGELAYKTFLVDGKVKGGRNTTSYIRFTDRYAGKVMGEEERDIENYKILEQAGEEKEIYEINPYPFSRMDYLIMIDAERMLERNSAFERAFKLETYDRAISNPLVLNDPEAQQKITRDFLFEPLMKGEASKYLPNISKVANSLLPSSEGKSGLTGRVLQGAAMGNLSV